MTVENRPGIYKFTNTKNGKCYVGSSKRVRARWRSHLRCFERGDHPSVKLKRAVVRYGLESFAFEVIEYCSESLLMEREQYWIDTLDSYRNGYNARPLAESNRGLPLSEEHRQKLKQARALQVPHRGWKHSPYAIERQRSAAKARGISPELRQKMLAGRKPKPAWNRGRPFSEESRARMSEAHKGKVPWNKGKTFSEESRRKMSASQQGKKRSPEAIAKTAAANTGRVCSPEKRQKLSEARYRYLERLRDVHA